MRRIDDKYHIDIHPATHGDACSYALTGAKCNCGAQPRPVIVNTTTGAILPEDEPLILIPR
jgi:hypothetical protein